MKKSLFFLFIIGLTFCHNPASHKVERETVQVDKEKAMEHWDKATSSLQFSDYHRIHYDSAFLYYPDSSEIVQRYSYSYKKTGEHIKAMQLLNQAIELNPKEALEYRAWSMLYFYRHYEKTIADIDALLKLTNTCMEACWGESCKYQRFLALYKLEKYDDALKEMAELKQCEQDYGINPDDNYNYNFYTARCYHKMQEYEMALQYYDRLFEKEAGVLAEYPYYKGLVLIELGDKTQACELFQDALKQVKRGNKYDDPYIELFDEVYLWMIEAAIDSHCEEVVN